MASEHGEPWRTWQDAIEVNDGRIVAQFISETARERAIACVNACDGVATEHLTPGCVAKMVEALERIARRDEDLTISDAIQSYRTARDALAAMKGV